MELKLRPVFVRNLYGPMARQLQSSDIEILETIAEFRILSISHLSIILSRNTAALRRRLRFLETKKLILVSKREFKRAHGRPENLISLGEVGIEVLKTRNIIDRDLPIECIAADNLHCLDHELLINDFRVQLELIKTIVPELEVSFLSVSSPKLYRTDDKRALIYERIPPDEENARWYSFIPDGVFAIRHAEAGNTVLLFLEVDMGSEAVASPSAFGSDIRGKIDNYKRYFLKEHYKHYEQMWGCDLCGFRLLFLTHSADRLASLCRLVVEMQPSNFIWLTDRTALMSQGGWSSIWIPGGEMSFPRDSILGELTPCPSPSPADVI